ncbi:MAG: hypothetical protein R3327_01730 [Nitrosopumilaceae archaeon]|nr:hypothetical protein [Nitrosopumilaceae archaeon]
MLHMVKPIVLAFGAIPVIIAMLIAIPLLTQPEIPFSAANPNDRISIEYIKHDLKKVSFGVTERVGSEKTQILSIDENGQAKFSVTESGYPQPEIKSEINNEQVRKLIALIKETGFMAIPSESFPVKDDVDEYTKSSVKITLNGAVTQIYWPEQNATDKLIPPIITQVESELENIVQQIRE